MRAALLLLLLSLAAAWPRLGAPWQPGEAEAVAAAAAIEAGGDWIGPLSGAAAPRPPLVPWLLAVLGAADTDPAWPRLLSVLGFCWLAVVAFRALRRRSSLLAACIAATGILASPFVLLYVPSAAPAPLFAALTGVSVVWLAEGAAFGQRPRLAAAGAVGGLALLAGGLLYFAFFAGVALVWLRRLRLTGLPWFAAPLALVSFAGYAPLLLRADAAAAAPPATPDVPAWIAAAVTGIPPYLAGAVLALLPLGLWTFYEYRGDREMREAVLGRDEAFLRLCAGAMVAAVPLLALSDDRSAGMLLAGVPCYIVALGPATATYARSSAPPTMLLGWLVRGTAIVALVGLLATPWLPAPYDRRTPWLFAALAVAPLWCRTRAQIVQWALLMPLVAAWTVLPDGSRQSGDAPRPGGSALETRGGGDAEAQDALPR